MKDLTIGFIGLGLIGGSIARGIKRSRREHRRRHRSRSILRMSRKSWSRYRILSIKSTCLRKKLIHPRRKPAFIRAF